MYEVIPNRAKNRIFFRMDGFLTDEEVHEVVERMIAGIKSLQPGFDVINDLSSFKPVSPEGVKEIERLLRFSNEYGVRYVMRVSPPNIISRMQFDRIYRTTESNSLTEYVASREEAERRLDELNAAAHKEKPKK